MSLETGQKFFIKDVGVKEVDLKMDPETGKSLTSDPAERRFLSTAVLLDPNEVVSPYGEVKSVSGIAKHEDPVKAVHCALQDATGTLLPGRPEAELVGTTVMPTVPTKGFVSSAEFRVGEKISRFTGTHPTSELGAKVDAVVRAHNTLYND